MDTPTVTGAASSAMDTARSSRSSYSSGEPYARSAQAEATVALALAVREAGAGIAQGLQAIAQALSQR